MKIFYFFTFSVLLSLTASAQVKEDYYINPDSSVSKTQIFNNKYNNSPFSNKTHVSLQTGACLSAFGKETIFNTWVAPEINYALSPRFNLTLGTMVMHGNLNSFSGSINKENINSKNTGLTRFYMFAQGEYFFNDNISITGTTMRELPNLSINPNPSVYNSVGMNIKLSENVSISTNCTFSKGINYYGMPGNNASRQSAFPFNNNFSSFKW